MAKTEHEVEDACRDLLEEFDSSVYWKWDERFGSLLAEFSVKNQDMIISILEKYFESKWDKKTIQNAPGFIKQNTYTFKDMKQGQFLFTSPVENEDLIFAAWWPWGDGESISVRVLSNKINTSNTKSDDFLSRLMNIFK